MSTVDCQESKYKDYLENSEANKPDLAIRDLDCMHCLQDPTELKQINLQSVLK
jgi:hypothetical protein